MTDTAAPAALDADALAAEILDAIETGRAVDPPSGRIAIDVPGAYRTAGAMRRLRETKGARHVGRKIGFSNRTIWPIYGIDAPIWGDMYDTTVRDVAPGDTVALGRLNEPRIEPEIAFCLSAVPTPGMSDAELLGCCEWLAHGVELVHSPYPGWKFRTPDTIASGGLHGMMLLGARVPARPDWLGPLGDFQCRLSRDGAVVAEGSGANVLDGPLKALGHLAAVLAGDPGSAPLGSGEIITTGTLTDALPVTPGERWTTALDGLDLPGIDIRFA